MLDGKILTRGIKALPDLLFIDILYGDYTAYNNSVIVPWLTLSLVDKDGIDSYIFRVAEHSSIIEI